MNQSCASPALPVFVTAVIENFNITLVTQTLKGNDKQFKLAGGSSYWGQLENANLSCVKN